MLDASCPIVVLGGRSLVGRYLMDALLQSGAKGFVTSRGALSTPSGFERVDTADLRSGVWQAPEGAIVLSLWPIWLLTEVLPSFARARKIIALSSTSLFGKQNSADPHEKEVVQQLADGEARLRQFAQHHAIAATILRPTLIYDGVSDRSITQIVGMMRRLHVFVVAGAASGLRQPIHAGDVALAMIAAAEREGVAGRSINIGGGETLTYREMAVRIAKGVGGHVAILSWPLWLCRLAMGLLATAGLTRLSPSLFDRMGDDLVFDHGESVELLGVAPRGFHPDFTAAP